MSALKGDIRHRLAVTVAIAVNSLSGYYLHVMIKTLRTGEYKLLETKDQNKILILDNKETFAWINAENIGILLATSHRHHKIDNVLATGKYRLYEVKDEPQYTDLTHLELMVGVGVWQGYLLLTSLPTQEKSKSRIIPTDETITSPIFKKFRNNHEADLAA